MQLLLSSHLTLLRRDRTASLNELAQTAAAGKLMVFQCLHSKQTISVRLKNNMLFSRFSISQLSYRKETARLKNLWPALKDSFKYF